MNAMELMLTLVFVVPIVVICIAFALCVVWMQVQDNQASVEKHGVA